MGRTALMLASQMGHREICSLLIEKGAALDIKGQVSMAGICACMYVMGSRHRGVTWEPACDGDGDGWCVCPDVRVGLGEVGDDQVVKFFFF
jgi:hypothetical protein